jgi:putative mRNA 3-end processing factor
VEPGAAHRYGADRAFPLSDHADFAGLVNYARATGAQEVLTHHGFAVELAHALRARGIEARPVGTLRQMELFAPRGPGDRSEARKPRGAGGVVVASGE